MNNNDYLIIDFDSTFIKLETLEEISKEALKNNPKKDQIQREIEEITQQGMQGKISFAESLRSRLKLFSTNKKDINSVNEKIKKSVTDSFLENKDFFRKYGKQIFVISGGFKECIFPVTDDFEIPRENVLANDFKFDEKGKVIGIDENNLASKTQGKVRQAENLNLKGRVFVVGDGWTDFEIKREKQADYFLAFTENVRRESVVELADGEVRSFGEAKDFVEKKQ
jgi:D-3-phosphoglycerate dehydrogenase